MTIAGDSLAAAQALMGVNVLPPWTLRAPIDVGAVVALYGIVAGDRSQSRSLYVRQHLLSPRGGLWIGAAISQIDRTASFSSNSFDAGGWTAHGRTRYTATVTTTSTTDRDVFLDTPFGVHPFVERVRVADASLRIERSGTTFDTELEFGGRFSVEGIDGAQGFANVSIAWRLVHSMRMVVSGGTRLADPLRGTPAWSFASAGIRLASPSSHGIPVRGRSAPPLEATRLSSGRVRIEVAAPATAHTVEIAGTLTGWQPMVLVNENGAWGLTLTIPSGAQRVQVRVDGGEWRVPANLAIETDEFGKRSGVIIVP
jgi:hypothetical protein